jgi:sulfate transport system ATP-binding protein
VTIVLDRLTKRFNHALVVNGVSLEVKDGEFFVLLGRSGSGKSTILRLVAGLLTPDGGRIELHGRDVTGLRPQERNVGFVFQNYSIFHHMTAAENIEFGLRIRRVPAAKRRQKADELLDLVGLGSFGDRYPAQLSGGQQQRVALARALAYDPSVLLLDEPFGALDVVIRSQLRQALREVQRRLRVTTILVTHDQEEAFELADRIGVVERGRIVEAGTPEDLYHKPRTEFVASFVGGGNLLAGRSADGGVALGSAHLPLPPDAPPPDKGAPVRVLIRPEVVAVRAAPFDPAEGLVPLGEGRVVGTRFAGPVQRVRVEVEALRGVRQLAPSPDPGKGAPVLEAALASVHGPALTFAPGDRVHVGVRKFHILEPAGIKILIGVEDARAPTPAVAFGGTLAARTHGEATLFTVVPSPEDVRRAEEALAALREQLLASVPHPEAHVRHGEAATELLHEAQEGGHDLVVVGRRASRRPAGLPVGPTARSLLEEAGVPVLVVPRARDSFQRILICTAATTPDLPEVLVGGRLARAAGASATVLHIPGRRATPRDLAQAELHLQRTRDELLQIGVDVTSKLGWGSGAETILREAAAGEFDLVIVGAPAARSSRRLLWSDAVGDLLERADRPVLIVPAPA